MKVSIIIPAYNESKNIYDCVMSIKTEIAGTSYPTEIIVIDNLSKDKTFDEAERAFPDLIVRRGPSGVVWARQEGYMLADGDFLAFIDADSRMPKGWLQQALKAFSNPKVVAVSGPMRFYDFPELNPWAARFFRVQKFAHRFFPSLIGGNCIIRKSALDKLKGFDTSIAFYGEDTFTATRLAKVGKVEFDPNLWINSSGRRFKQGGVIKTTLLYVSNYFSVSIIKAPLNNKYQNYR